MHRYMAYPFLKEKSKQCDYEIATDELASMLGYAIHLVHHIPELPRLVELVYHLNGSIRGTLGVEEQDKMFLSDLYDTYSEKVGIVDQFVLPGGCSGGSYLHVVRSKVKEVLRIAYAIDQSEKTVERIIFDVLNILSNLIFLMVLYENKQERYDEIIFISKSYGN